MNSILLIRHAQSANNALPESQRVPDPGITPLGMQQAHRLGQNAHKLRVTELFCSPFRRSLETTRPIAQQTKLTPFVHADIYEQGGCYSGHLPGQEKGCPGMGRTELESAYPGWKLDPSISDLGWNHGRDYESDKAVRIRARRVERWLAESVSAVSARNTLADRVLALVIHADFKRVLMEAMLDSDLWPQSHQPIWNTSVSHLILSGDRWQLIDWNNVDHLDPDLLTH